MPDPKQEYIKAHVDDEDLVARFPNFKDRRNECERQFVAGKLRDKPAPPPIEVVKDGQTPDDEQQAAADQILTDAEMEQREATESPTAGSDDQA